MKPASPELLALLKTRQFFAADLYAFTLVDGTVLRYCGGDQDLTVNGALFPAGKQVGPYFDRKDNKAKCHWKVGVETDTLVVDVIPGSATVEGAPFLQAVHAGAFDGAELVLDRVYMPSYGDTRRGFVRMFVGRVAEIDSGRSVATFSINSHLELLNLQLPRNLYQPGCVNSLGDAACTTAVPGTACTAAAGSTTTAVTTATALAAAESDGVSPYALGKIAFTSGALTGVVRGVLAVAYGSPSVITIRGQLPAAPSAGDGFGLYFGCNKSLTSVNGCPKFSNQAHFRGFPFVPQPATAV